MTKKIHFSILMLLCNFIMLSQTNEIVKAINENAFRIKDVNPNIEVEKNPTLDSIFKDVRIFGFGEATHGTKEFFDLKVKFFKYVVKNQAVKNFAIEASYGNCIAINDYIHGKNINPKIALNNIGFWIWNCTEVLDLIEWMKVYNRGKNTSEQLSFHGVDSKDCATAAKIMYDYIKVSNIEKKEEYLKIIATYSKTQNIKDANRKELKNHLVVMTDLKTVLNNNAIDSSDFYVRTQEAIIQYIEFSLNYNQTTRDTQMAENVNKVLTSAGAEGKVFLWAHNLHVNKDKIQSNIPSMGNHLKQKYGNQYYSVGFDFATGKFNALDLSKNRLTTSVIDNVMKNTSNELFDKCTFDTYLLDFNTAIKTSVLADYLNSKVTHQGIGSTFDPKMVIQERLIYSFDAIIFVKNTTESTLLHN
ncbi:erythromycin esterase family protein [Flavobacterium sp. 14A]|uniref:erythromycin esterase family protein n=1 Tax=Flavobacterium sp. 14A TaxID=2735896 RepID=UPI00156DEAB8|nr:erythromycin esterase family protein [Flavobacterium sp. 14A]NRT11963.1 erythromycin esterase [Flavobacterium sp. 14A]